MTNHLIETYQAYQDTEIEWLPKIPKHWGLKRLKELSDIQNSNVDKKSHENEVFVRLCNYVDVYKNEFISSSINFMEATADESEIKKFRIKKDDVLITKDSETFDDIAVSALVLETMEDVICGYHLAQIKTNKKLLFGPYLFRLFQSKQYGFRFSIHAKGITRVGLGQSGIRDALTPIPSIPEQKAIANYLDTRTEFIDRKIDLLTQKAKNYSDLKQALINESVTHGLDKNVPMKDSGVEWIGHTPAHWDVKRINDAAVEQKIRNLGLSEKNLLSLSYGKLIRRDFDTSFGLLPESFETYQIINKGNIILRLTDLQNDKTSLRVGLSKERGIITSAYLCITFSKFINPTFAYYLLHAYDLSKVFYWFGNGLRQTMKFDEIKVLPFICPPKEEQDAIVLYLDEKTNQIERIIETIEAEINVLKELRLTLINDVVTGKIKVS